MTRKVTPPEQVVEHVKRLDVQTAALKDQLATLGKERAEIIASAALAAPVATGGEAVGWMVDIPKFGRAFFHDEADARAQVAETGCEHSTVSPVYRHPAPSETGASAGVKVKALVWSDRGETCSHQYKAEAIVGPYLIERTKGGLFNWWTSAMRGKIETRTLDAAKAAAQADYETRIRAALEGRSDG